MRFTLYALTDLDAPCPIAKGEKWRRWARAVRRHQRRMMARFLAELNGEVPKVAPPEPSWMPWTIEDLISRRKYQAGWSSAYYGVSKTPMRVRRQGWLGYRPASNTKSRKALGFFATEQEAAVAVLLAINPNAVITPTPTESIAHE